MKAIVQHEKYGTIIYSENFWNCRKSLVVDGVKATKHSRTEFTYNLFDGTPVNVKLKGHQLAGVKGIFNGEEVCIVAAPKWYEVVISIITFALIMVWGNSTQLCSIVPVLGGALGGLISAACIMCGLNISRKTKNGFVKLLISLGVLVVTFALCALGALLLLSAVA